MSDWDFTGVMDVISNGTNPEFLHARNGSHPGIGWSIKTVIPKPRYAGIDSRGIIEGWSMMCALHPMLVTWSDDAYDWAGNHLEEWQTMWVRDGWDVLRDDASEDVPVFKLVTAAKNREPAIESIVDDLRAQLVQSTDASVISELTDLLEVAEAMLSQASEQDSKAMRNNLRFVDDD